MLCGQSLEIKNKAGQGFFNKLCLLAIEVRQQIKAIKLQYRVLVYL